MEISVAARTEFDKRFRAAFFIVAGQIGFAFALIALAFLFLSGSG